MARGCTRTLPSEEPTSRYSPEELQEITSEVVHRYLYPMTVPESEGVEGEVIPVECRHGNGVGSLIGLSLLPCPLHGAAVQVSSIIATLENTYVHSVVGSRTHTVTNTWCYVVYC